MWHTLRGEWWNPGLTAELRARLAASGWSIEDPTFRQAGGLDLSNGAGEDFLYMHRRMVRMLADVYQGVGRAPPAAWIEIPSGLGPQVAYRAETDP